MSRIGLVWQSRSGLVRYGVVCQGCLGYGEAVEERVGMSGRRMIRRVRAVEVSWGMFRRGGICFGELGIGSRGGDWIIRTGWDRHGCFRYG